MPELERFQRVPPLVEISTPAPRVVAKAVRSVLKFGEKVSHVTWGSVRLEVTATQLVPPLVVSKMPFESVPSRRVWSLSKFGDAAIKLMPEVSVVGGGIDAQDCPRFFDLKICFLVVSMKSVLSV